MAIHKYKTSSALIKEFTLSEAEGSSRGRLNSGTLHRMERDEGKPAILKPYRRKSVSRYSPCAVFPVNQAPFKPLDPVFVNALTRDGEKVGGYALYLVFFSPALVGAADGVRSNRLSIISLISDNVTASGSVCSSMALVSSIRA
jgi:hypothetical protein